jgi:hypothetical protein
MSTPLTRRGAAYKAEIAAENVLRYMRPDASDEDYAAAVAEYALAKTWFPRGAYHMSVFDYDDARPLSYDWRGGSNVVISTRDRERAKEWSVEALLEGYTLYRGLKRFSRKNGFTGYCEGSITDYRKWALKHETRRERSRQTAESRL